MSLPVDLEADLAEVSARVHALADERGPSLGSSRLVCIDGPSGSGKTVLAERIGAPVVHTDDLLEGWTGLPTLDRQVLALLAPLAHDLPARWRRWDWTTSARAEEHCLAPAPLLVLEGVGAGQRAWADRTAVLVWVETEPRTGLARATARDGEAIRPHLEWWQREERRLFARDGTRARADLVLQT